MGRADYRVFIDASNWERINHRIIESRKDPGFQADWLARVGIGRVITDDYAQPTVDVRPILGKGYASVMRINAFCLSHHPSVRDHNGNNGIELLERAGLHPGHLQTHELPHQLNSTREGCGRALLAAGLFEPRAHGLGEVVRGAKVSPSTSPICRSR